MKKRKKKQNRNEKKRNEKEKKKKIRKSGSFFSPIQIIDQDRRLVGDFFFSNSFIY